MSAHEPCRTCPWRRTSPVGGEEIPRFDQALMDALACTVGEEDGFRQVMACHYSGTVGAFACRGYVYRHGRSNLWVRILAAHGVLDLPAIEEACEPLDLWPDFETMLAAYQEANR